MRMSLPTSGRALVLAFILVSAPSAYGQETPRAGIGSLLSDHHIESPAVSLKLRNIGYGQESDSEARRKFLDSEILGSFQGRFGDRLHYTLSPQIRFDNADRTGTGFEFSERSPTRPLFTFKEAYAAWYGDVCEVIVGKKVFSWGVGDGFRPADNLNPYDFLDVIEAEKIGIPALSIFRYGELISTQVVFIPVFIPGRLPEVDNRWAFEDAAAMDRIHDTFGDWYAIADGGRELPGASLANAQYALRLSSSTLLMGWDLSLSFFRGRYAYGVLFLEDVVFPPAEPDAGLQPPVLTIAQVYPEYREITAGVSTTAGNWEFHAGGALHHTMDRAMDDSFSEYVVGFNHTLYDPGVPFLREVRSTVEYAGIGVTRERPSDSRYSGAGFGRGLDNALLANLQLKISEDTSLDMGGAMNLDPGDRYTWIALSHRIWDRITLEADYQTFTGPPDSFFGGWDDNDRFVLRITGGF